MKRQTPDTVNTDAPDVAPPPAIPLGTAADVTVKYKTTVDPNQAGSERERQSRHDELADLVDLADEGEEAPFDEVTEFCQRWQNFAGHLLSVYRHSDPPERRMPGNSYVRPCFTPERLGDTTFDPANLIGTLQYINQNSGGVFRVWLTYNGSPVPGARIERLAIADPPGSHTNAPAAIAQQFAQPPPPPAPIIEREKSETEKQIEDIQRRLFQSALDRALNPPIPPAISATGSSLAIEDQATLFLLNKTDFLTGIFGKLTDLAQQAAGAGKEPTLKERMADAAVEIVTKNPAIVDRVGSLADRLLGRIFGPDPRYDAPTAPPQAPIYQQTPAYMPQQQTAPAPAPSDFYPDSNPPDAPEPDDDVNVDDDIMDILDQLITLLNSNKPLVLNDPVFLQLRDAYPMKFRLAIGLIASQPLDTIVDWIKDTGGPLYVSLLDGPASGPFLHIRLGELQALIIEANNNVKKQQQQTAPAPETKQPEGADQTDAATDT